MNFGFGYSVKLREINQDSIICVRLCGRHEYIPGVGTGLVVILAGSRQGSKNGWAMINNTSLLETQAKFFDDGISLRVVAGKIDAVYASSHIEERGGRHLTL